jgi:hypothetical protein
MTLSSCSASRAPKNHAVCEGALRCYDPKADISTGETVGLAFGPAAFRDPATWLLYVLWLGEEPRRRAQSELCDSRQGRPVWPNGALAPARKPYSNRLAMSRAPCGDFNGWKSCRKTFDYGARQLRKNPGLGPCRGSAGPRVGGMPPPCSQAASRPDQGWSLSMISKRARASNRRRSLATNVSKLVLCATASSCWATV